MYFTDTSDGHSVGSGAHGDSKLRLAQSSHQNFGKDMFLLRDTVAEQSHHGDYDASDDEYSHDALCADLIENPAVQTDRSPS